MMRREILAAPLLFFVAGCTVGPNYHRPPVNAPNQYYNAPPGASTAASLGNEKWWAVFQDPVLQKLIHTAISQNYDVRIAASRVLQAQAQVGLARANQLPSLSGVTELLDEKLPGIPAFKLITLGGMVSYTPDFWGQYRRATEAARATMLSEQWSRKETIATVVSNVATSYFQIRALDLQLSIAQKTLADQREYLKLTETLFHHGASSLVDVQQAEQLVASAAAAIPQTELEIKQQEDQLSILLGENPHEIPRGWELTEEPLPVTIPAGLPSHLLERRPDIQAAEKQLVSANAEIGVARAQFFPSLPLTGSGGWGAASFGQGSAGASVVGGGGIAGSDPASGGSSSFATGHTYDFTATGTQPIFTGGRLQSNLKLAEAQKQQALLTYQQTIQQAFQQVSNALAAFQKYRDYRAQQAAFTRAAGIATSLSETLYRGGAASFLQVLTNQTNYFSAQLNLVQADLDQRLALVQLYIALGGGWEQ
jgi:outer membrane protein, multidrug efflux system